ncbi:hypothetical protein MPTK1_3g08870 [Marchantia polymorpha subsp. ruderalis]|uniref:Uncharacterized protein n=2 Tax=Marchantia polymorpha TaxID=3197 RepID=A0A176WNQ4_MARPO|nr:hypothetical protein AXG93_2528s1460 [Marchantia polymorpha subsp. ruderalis]PTQ31915.1 hypothetical protein MARPO_0105s0030 [Marchantia polymorpha]BBN04929.1 hypothetical protein Mp_3g08870 [Marchantia polymorpha subsp. ruderalis]|eukprot:PTQ31915.1 hypothetical protein MARPO_0105s0030 [Marchantia polymorpha]
MVTEEKRKELDDRARAGEVVVPGGRGGNSLEAQVNLAKGRIDGGQTRLSQLGKEGYREMGLKGVLSTREEWGGKAAKLKGINIDESKLKTGTKE